MRKKQLHLQPIIAECLTPLQAAERAEYSKAYCELQNVAQTARQLGVARMTALKKLRKYGLRTKENKNT